MYDFQGTPGPFVRSVFTNVDCATGVHTARIGCGQMDSCAHGIWEINGLQTICPDVSLCGDMRLLADMDTEEGGNKMGMGTGQRHASFVLPNSGCGEGRQRQYSRNLRILH